MNESTTAFVSNRQMKQRMALMQMAQEVEQLLKEHQEQEGLTWTGSKADLMEALYYAFESGCLHDDYGMLLTFADIVRRGCTLLHIEPSRNPYVTALRARQRKGMKNLNYLERYQIMMDKYPINTIWTSICKDSTAI